MAVAPWIVSDALWKRVESLLRRRKRRFRYPGRKRLDDRAALHALLLAELQAAGEIEWTRAVADSSHRAVEKGGAATGRRQIHEAFLAIGCCLVCFRRPARSF